MGAGVRRAGRGTAALAFGIAGLSVVLTGSAVALLIAVAESPDPNTLGGFVLGFTYPLVGALVASRQTRNPIGWIYLGVGLSQSLGTFTEAYARYGLVVHPGTVPLAELASWVAMWAWAPGLVLFSSIAPLLFPNGHHLSPRWRYVTGAAGMGIALIVIPMAVVAWPHRGIELVVANALGGDTPAVASALPWQGVGLAIWALATVAALVSLLLRWRGSRGIEREQLKWLAFALSLTVPALLFQPSMPLALAWILVPIVTAVIPVAVGVAILRYRLYGIDRLINRTIVYVMLTAVLAGIYSAAISLAQRMLAATGRKSDSAIVFTALAVGTLFTPIKNALQSRVDRRFKAPRDPRASLADLASTVDSRMWAPDRMATLRRLLDVAVSAFGAAGGSVSVADDAVASAGSSGSGASLTVAAGEGAQRVTILIEARTNGEPYDDADRRALVPAVEAVARALA